MKSREEFEKMTTKDLRKIYKAADLPKDDQTAEDYVADAWVLREVGAILAAREAAVEFTLKEFGQ